ncbi:MAG: TDP-N-acetylfucosamine:lipid II N-acetylfucosaminyltransferase [Chitinophagales bacterium]
MNVHLVLDEKFTDDFIKTIDLFGDINNNIFLCRSSKPFKYVKEPMVVEAKLWSKTLKENIESLSAEDTLIIHNMRRDVTKWLIKTKTHCKVAWIFWGIDFYTDSGIVFPLYDSESERIVLLHPGYKKKLLNKFPFRNLLEIAKPFLIKRDKRLRQESLRKVDFIYHYNIYDYELLKSYFQTGAKFKKFFYSRFYWNLKHNTTVGKSPFSINPNNTHILIGNSGDPTNNHLDLFKKIPNRDDLEVWVPLSYGNSKYIDLVIENGTSLYKENFHGITKYYNYPDYFTFLEQIDVCVMGHLRSQGMGNIIIFLYLGKTVFMYPEITTFRFLEKIGVKVFSIEGNSINLDLKITKEDQIKNRQIIEDFFLKEGIEEVYKTLFS